MFIFLKSERPVISNASMELMFRLFETNLIVPFSLKTIKEESFTILSSVDNDKS